MNKLAEFYNREIRLHNLEEHIIITEKKIKYCERLRSVLLPTNYVKLLYRVSSIIEKEKLKLWPLRDRKYLFKERFGVNKNE